MKKKAYILDISTGVTGALKAAIYTAQSICDDYDITFIIPSKSSSGKFIKSHGFKVTKIFYFPLRKRLLNLLLYLPAAIYSTCQLRLLLSGSPKLLIINDHNIMLGGVIRLLNWKGAIVSYVRRIPSSQGRLLSKLFIKVISLSSNKIIAVSKCVKRELHECHNVELIYDTVKLRNVAYTKKCIESVPIRFLYLANYMEGKGQYEALLAFKNAIEINSDLHLKFVGGDLGLSKNIQFMNKVKSEVSKLGINQHIEFGGYTSNVEEEILNSDVLINFSKSESFSMTCAEAAMLGCSSIATKCGGPEEIILNFKSGILVEIDNINEMTEAMIYFADNPSKIEEFGKNAQNRFNDLFSFERYARDTKAMIGAFRCE